MERDFQIRPAAVGDAAAISVLSREALGYSYPEEETRIRLAALLEEGRDGIFVAQSGGEVIGYIHACDFNTLYFPPMKTLLGLAVAEGSRRLGVGGGLLEAIERWAAEKGASGVRLTSGEARKEAHEFYRRHGYGEDSMKLRLIKWL